MKPKEKKTKIEKLEMPEPVAGGVIEGILSLLNSRIKMTIKINEIIERLNE